MIITAILMTFAVKPSEKKMSDADVKKRAQELGMVEESSTLVQPSTVQFEDATAIEESTDATAVESTSSEDEISSENIDTEEKHVDSDAKENADEFEASDTVEKPENADESEVTEENKEADKPEMTEKVESVEKPEDTKITEKAEEPEKQEESKKQEKAEEPKKQDESKKNSTTTITVAGGSSSDTVAKLLEKGGIVDSAAKFDAYLCSNGYDKRIAAGNHVIPANADYKTIAEILVTR